MIARLDNSPLDDVADDDLFPLSFAQQRLWFLEQLEGAGAAYNVRLPVRVSGQLDLEAFQAAIDQLVSRHESLRTRIVSTAAGPRQGIAAQQQLAPEISELRSSDRDVIARRVAELADQRFDLARAPLLRIHLLRTADDEQVLLLVMHHIIADAWSSGVLFADLAALYNAHREKRPAALPELPVQYADFAVWQREWLQGEALQQQLDWWSTQLQGAPELLALPTDRVRPARQSYRGSRWGHALDAQLVEQLESLARKNSATLYMVLLAAYSALLSRYAGQTDLLIGSPVAGRPRAELEGVIGFFANTLALRMDLDGAPGFTELLARVRRTTLGAFEHQALPFEKLVEALKPERRLSHSPLFQVMFILQNAPWEAQSLDGLEISPAEIAPGSTAKFDLTLSAAVYEQELWLNFEYNSDLFDETSIERLANAYEQLLRAVLAEPERDVLSLPLTGDAQNLQRMAEWNATETALPPFADIDAMITAQMMRTPMAAAVADESQQWTYAELQARSESIAQALQAAGAQRNVPVAICLQRGAAMLAAVLGVLRSGAAYLPLDPAYPQPRLQHMLDDSGAAILISDTREDFSDYAGSCLQLDADARVVAQLAGRLPVRPLKSEQALAYLIYTSGSTGHPKAVMVTQSAVLNFLASMARQPGIDADDCLLAVTTLSFDISVLELLLPLSVGARVVVAPSTVTNDGKRLAQWLDQSAVSMMQATPATWRLLLSAGWVGRKGLKMLCGGEALDSKLARKLLARGASLWNLYGPTETTIWSTLARVRDADDITVGTAISNTQVHICGSDLSLQPLGVPGELCIGGAGVALGYLHQPELSAERFVADPFSSESGARFYRTGDRARWRADGQLELLGRMDRQVKLRGFRIELGETEAALARCTGVQAAAVELLKAPAGEQRLVAWVVASTSPDELALRAELAERLPDYMLPTAWLFVPALPLTPNGKLDRAGLPAPDWQGGQRPGRAAATPLEALIGEVMSAVLGVSGVQATDDFFALGGHSLLATQLISRLRDALGLELELRAVFTAPTPAGLAAQIQSAEPGIAVAPIPSRGALTQAPASFMQRRLWFLDQLQPGSSVYHLAWSLRLDGALDRSALQAAVAGLQARHESLRTCFVAADGEPYQLIAEVSSLPVDFAGVKNSELAKAMRDYVEQSFVLSTGPLWRVGVFTDAPDSQVLVLVIHHIVADGWSLSLLFQELSELYVAAREQRAPRLVELPLQYADYALWQQALLSGPELTRQLGYWRERLAGAPAALPLPADRPRPRLQRHRGERLVARLDANSTAALHALCQQQQVTLFMLLLAGFQAQLARWSGAEDLVVGTPHAGRGRSELEGLVGFFVNTLPLRSDLSGNPTLVELLAQVRSTALDAFAHPDLPFERLVDELNLPRDPGRTPLFQVMFNLHNESSETFSLPGLQSGAAPVQRATAKFDLSLSVTESSDGLSLVYEFDRDLFDTSTLSWLSESYLGLLRSWPASPQLRLSELSLPGALPSPSLPSLPAFSQAGSLGAAFAARAALGPKALAVASGAQRWSYGALLEVAHRVAQGLLSAGGAVGDRVGLVARPSADGVAGLLGILLAGRAYVPLDPAQPVARLRRLVALAGCQRLVASDELLELAEQLACPAQRIDSRADGRSTPAPELAVPAETLAYLMFTSGSTGEPKAVMQSHAGVLSQVARYAASLQLCADDRLSQLSSFGFDAAVQDVFGALLSGASLHPLDVRSEGDGAETVDALVAAGVSVVHATPTVYRHLFGSELSCRHALTSIRAVVLGGELARRTDFALFCTRFARGTRLVNGYGLTESTVVSQWQGDHDSRVAGDGLPLGQAVPGISIELWDAQGQPSWRGEIVLRGSGLAQGYWGDAELTAARFADGVYRSGDLGRWQADGQLAFVGRRDDQVKLRGVRVSLAEVEQCLGGAPGVSGCAVSLRTLADGQAQLVAYVSGPAAEELAAVQRWAVTQLAPWQLPAVWVRLDELPRRANGKLDRDRLPAVQRAAGLPPRTELERALAGLWSELLGVERIRREDDFFALGGHSLMATRLIARIRQKTGIEISLLSLFENPTVSGLARTLAEASSGEANGSEPSLRRLNRGYN